MMPAAFSCASVPNGSQVPACPSTPSESKDEKLVILAEPKPYYRDRYSCETDPNKKRARRFIRAENGKNQYEYPTVKVGNIHFYDCH